MLRQIRQILVFPIAFLYVCCFVLYYFVVLYINLYCVENIIQIIYVRMNAKLDSLVRRATNLAPLIYGLLVLKLVFLFFKK